ncbi:MAG: hypothetical protein IJS74_02700 [Clostridia bacterium]|nr:hypothetical protein [Clostridia bacterium]
MEYNKTKRGLEKAAGIVGVVASSILILTFIILLIYCITQSGTYEYEYYDHFGDVHTYVEYINPQIATFIGLYCFICIFNIALNILALIFSAKVIKTPVQADGTITQRNGSRISMLVFNILTGKLVSAGLMIAVLCLKDKVAVAPTNGQI